MGKFTVNPKRLERDASVKEPPEPSFKKTLTGSAVFMSAGNSAGV
jgi:hypothetical protein